MLCKMWQNHRQKKVSCESSRNRKNTVSMASAFKWHISADPHVRPRKGHTKHSSPQKQRALPTALQAIQSDPFSTHTHTHSKCSKVLRPLFVSNGKVLQGHREVITRGLKGMFHAVMCTGSRGHCHSQLLHCNLPHFLHTTVSKYTAEAQSIDCTRY